VGGGGGELLVVSGNGIAYVFLAARCVQHRLRAFTDDTESRDKAEARAAGVSMPEPPNQLPDLDPVVHGKMRLALLSLLTGVDEADSPGCGETAPLRDLARIC